MRNFAILSLALAPLVTGCTIQSESTPTYATASGGSNGSTTNSTDGEHSANLDTYEMAASMSAQSDGTTTKIYASLFDVSTAGAIVLDQGDYFTATTGSGDPFVLVLEPSADTYTIHYSASFPASADAQDITIAFVRQSGRTSAPRSTIHVPAPFALTSTSSLSVAYSSAISIHATPILTGDNVLEATGDCLETSAYGNDPNTFTNQLTFDSNGDATIDTSLLVFNGYETSGQKCSVSFYVSASSEGTLDPAFAGGASGYMDIVGLQKRGLQATVVAP